jgi:hypothetical protein
MKPARLLILMACMLLAPISGCAPNVLYRDKVEACGLTDAEFTRCSIEDRRDQNYILGFVEFDDQGIPYTRPSDGRNPNGCVI